MSARKLAPVVFTFWAMVALIAYAATRPNKLPAEPERTVRQLEPLTEEECKRFGEDFARAVSRQHSASVGDALRLREIAKRATADLGLTPADERELFGDNVIGPNQYVNQIVDAIKPGDEFVLRRVRVVNGRWKALFRHRAAGVALYTELTLARYPDGQIGAEDQFEHYHGHSLSSMMRETAVTFLVARRRSALDRLTGTDREFADDQKLLSEVLGDVRSGLSRAALAKLRALPDRVRDKHAIRQLLLGVAESTGERHEYFAELERAHARTPNDPALDLRSLDFFFAKMRYDDAGRALDRLLESVGPDGHLLGLRAETLRRTEQRQRAKETAERAYADEPSVDTGHAVRLALAVEEGNHTDTLLWLKKGIETRVCKVTTEALAGDAAYAEFVKSSQFVEFTKWLAERKK